MNGTGHLVEDFAAPAHACAADLRKMQFRLGFDVVCRYEQLESIWKGWKCTKQATWCRRQAEKCRREMMAAVENVGA